MSETGSGSIRDLRQRVAWAARTGDLYGVTPTATGRWVRDLAALGHVEADWESDFWAITPAAAALLPGVGGTAVLAGSRRVGVVDRLRDRVEVTTVTAKTGTDRILPTPSTVFVQADSLEDLAEAVHEVGVEFVGYSARNLAAVLPRISLGPAAAPPAHSDDVERLVSLPEVEWEQGRPDEFGLCRFKVHGRPTYLLLMRNGKWYRTDHATGVLLDRRGREHTGFMRFRSERTTNDTELGTLFLDWGTPLPALQTRALVLCTGLPVEFGSLARTTIYRNVPRNVAEQVASSVYQQLTDID